MTGIDRAVAREIVDRGYRQLVREHHPDGGGDHDRAVAVNLATEWLRDLAARAPLAIGAPPPPPPSAPGWCVPFDREHVEVCSVTCVRETVRALHCGGPWGRDLEWLPRSQICDASPVQFAGDRGPLVLTRWIAAQKGWLA